MYIMGALGSRWLKLRFILKLCLICMDLHGLEWDLFVNICTLLAAKLYTTLLLDFNLSFLRLQILLCFLI